MKSLKQLRLANHLTQKQLGLKLGVSESCVSLWESGKRFPRLKHLKKIAKFFQIELESLLD